ncbi:hypothetical protein ACIQVU_19300 [Lysinibacillus sp. NPDC098008]|uniref:hypothetical protein n=1 Tax=Lysinibacillus sp. NPDC098008 TaxID=3364146 RepID=UPI0037F61FF2
MATSKEQSLSNMIYYYEQLGRIINKKVHNPNQLEFPIFLDFYNKNARLCQATMFLLDSKFDEFAPHLIRTSTEITVDLGNLAHLKKDYLDALRYLATLNKYRTWLPTLQKEKRQKKIRKLEKKVREAKEALNTDMSFNNKILQNKFFSFNDKCELLEEHCNVLPEQIEFSSLRFLFYLTSSKLHSALESIKKYDNKSFYADMFAGLLILSAHLLIQYSNLEDSKKVKKTLKSLKKEYNALLKASEYEFDFLSIDIDFFSLNEND